MRRSSPAHRWTAVKEHHDRHRAQSRIGDATPAIAWSSRSRSPLRSSSSKVIGAIITGSLALLVDAAHMLTDVVGLAMAVTAAHLMNRPPTPKYTFGLRRTEVLGALAQATLLLGVGIFALVEGVRRLFEPPEIASGSLLFFASSVSSPTSPPCSYCSAAADAISTCAPRSSRSSTMPRFRRRHRQRHPHRRFRLVSGGRRRGRLDRAAHHSPHSYPVASIRSVLLESTPPASTSRMSAATSLPFRTWSRCTTFTRPKSRPTSHAHRHVVVDDTVTMEASAALLTSLQQCVNEHFAVSIEHSTFQIEPESHPGEHDTHA
ncbi:cation diffusion facilitator family transporter [Microbacterium hydrocarbonoxydans]|uniref:Cation diffusion facilitator family transporter n=1 Tax=Microbacterium hydrocarbonoxydans TaxID=273678 RepID=A0A1H4IN55_9MICO|nr:cation diffusion facilitator family transporter [Microbacterium hydrocarbonoxydans]